MALLGDSINHLVSNAAECFAAQEGEEWAAAGKADAAAHVTIRNAGRVARSAVLLCCCCALYAR